MEAVRDKPWTIVLLENANHDLIDNGTICQQQGPLADVLTPIQRWRTAICGPQ